MKYLGALSLALVFWVACSSNGSNETTANGGTIGLEPAFPNLTFEQPLDMQSPDDGTDRLFVVEQPGRIYVIPRDPAASEKTLFLNITARVNDQGWEEGLLGLAFHPDYATNGYFFVNYTASGPRRSVISRFSVDPADPDKADASSETVILTYDQPYGNHNGGDLEFGPDGYLYLGVGDGGSAGDPQGNGQNRATLLGTILRIDIDNTADGAAYGIPADNPFAGNDQGWAEEIYAYGLRNPWRFSFDPETGLLWTGDVGQNAIEEIDIIEAGGNYGWNIMEGTACYNNSSCDTSGLILPVFEYTHDEGQSITGGYVYRGSRRPDLVGKYLYADFMSGKLWALTYNPPEEATAQLLTENASTVASFAVDGDNEVYVLSFDGTIYRFTEPSQ